MSTALKCALIGVAVLLAVHLPARGESTIEIKSGFTLSWSADLADFSGWAEPYFDFNGYYRDYNSDGLADYFLSVFDEATGHARLVTIDTTPNGAAKTYAADKTAGRDFTAAAGDFVPESVHFVARPTPGEAPDLWIVGTNAPDVTAPRQNFTLVKFRRLDKTNTTFPTITSFDIAADPARNPIWVRLTQSYNGDDYPDILLHHSRMDAEKKFDIAIHDGLTGIQIWKTRIDRDIDDTDPPFPGLFDSDIYVHELIDAPMMGSTDYDNDGTQDLLVMYSFYAGDLMSGMSSASNFTLLGADGDFIAPYTGWQRLFTSDTVGSFYGYAPGGPFNADLYNDVIFLSTLPAGDPEPPVFIGYDLKNKAELFRATNSEFGEDDFDLFGYMTLAARNDDLLAFGDVNGDSQKDLAVHQLRSYTEGTPLHYGIFNGWAGGSAAKGDKIWLASTLDYNRSFYAGNLSAGPWADFMLVLDPAAPFTDQAGMVTYQLAEARVKTDDAELDRTFSWHVPAGFAFDPDDDSFIAITLTAYAMGNLTGGSDPQVAVTTGYSWFDHNASENDQSFFGVLVYNDDGSAGAPPIAGEFHLTMTDAGQLPAAAFLPALTADYLQSVDNNKDSVENDFIVYNPIIVAATSLSGAPPQPNAQLIIDSCLGRRVPTSGELAINDLNANGRLDVGDLLILYGGN